MWNNNWGEMIWGGAVAVPALSLAGVLALAAALAILGVRLSRRRQRPGLLLGILWALPVLLVAGGLTWAQVSIPHTFVNGTRADAVQVNENFQAVATAVNADHLLIKAGRAVVIESEFRANRPTAQVLFGLNGGGAAITNGASEPFVSSLVAPTHAPAGARITNVDLFYRDTDAALNLKLCLLSYDNAIPGGYLQHACVNSTGTPGTTTLTLALTTSPQDDRFFELRVSAIDAGGTTVAWPGTSLQARGAVVSYQFD